MKSNKELKAAYKLMEPQIGVFQIRNTINNKIFIDSSTNLDKIWNRYRSELKYGNHLNKLLQHDWNQFGEENFSYEILSQLEPTTDQTIDPKKEAKLLAKMFIEDLQPFGENGYNR